MDRIGCKNYIMALINDAEKKSPGLRQNRIVPMFNKIDELCNAIDIVMADNETFSFSADIDRDTMSMSVFVELTSITFSVGVVGSDEWNTFCLLIESESTSLSVSENGNLFIEFVIGKMWEEQIFEQQ